MPRPFWSHASAFYAGCGVIALVSGSWGGAVWFSSAAFLALLAFLWSAGIRVMRKQ